MGFHCSVEERIFMKKSDFYRFWNCFRAIVIGALVVILGTAIALVLQ